MQRTKHTQTVSQKCVLLVEDDRDVNDAFHTLLTAGGYQVQQVYNGKEALECVEAVQPDIILLDLMMPIMDGNAFLEAFDNKRNIPIIVFTNMDTRSEVSRALENGASRYMLKSWATPEELFRIINDLTSV